MADKKVCDNCGVESPDKHGLFQANHWVKVSVEWWDRWPHKAHYDFCVPCAKRAAATFEGLQHHSVVHHLETADRRET